MERLKFKYGCWCMQHSCLMLFFGSADVKRREREKERDREHKAKDRDRQRDRLVAIPLIYVPTVDPCLLLACCHSNLHTWLIRSILLPNTAILCWHASDAC